MLACVTSPGCTTDRSRQKEGSTWSPFSRSTEAHRVKADGDGKVDLLLDVFFPVLLFISVPLGFSPAELCSVCIFSTGQSWWDFHYSTCTFCSRINFQPPSGNWSALDASCCFTGETLSYYCGLLRLLALRGKKLINYSLRNGFLPV